MPTCFADTEIVERRRYWTTQEGTFQERVYPVDPNDTDDIPSEGDMLDGATFDVLGPFVTRNGVTYAQQRDGANQEVRIRYVTLATQA